MSTDQVWNHVHEWVRPLIAKEPFQKMTRGAKQYLLAKFTMLVMFGSLVAFFPNLWVASQYDIHHDILPFPVLGGALMTAGLMCGYAAWRATANFARFALRCSFVMTAVWVSGFVGELWFHHNPDALKSLPIYGCLAFIDWIQIQSPMKLPFEVVAEKVRDASPSATG